MRTPRFPERSAKAPRRNTVLRRVFLLPFFFKSASVVKPSIVVNTALYKYRAYVGISTCKYPMLSSANHLNDKGSNHELSKNTISRPPRRLPTLHNPVKCPKYAFSSTGASITTNGSFGTDNTCCAFSRDKSSNGLRVGTSLELVLDGYRMVAYAVMVTRTRWPMVAEYRGEAAR